MSLAGVKTIPGMGSMREYYSYLNILNECGFKVRVKAFFS